MIGSQTHLTQGEGGDTLQWEGLVGSGGFWGQEARSSSIAWGQLQPILADICVFIW